MNTTEQALIAEIESIKPGIFQTPEFECPVCEWLHKEAERYHILRDWQEESFWRDKTKSCPICHGSGYGPPGLSDVLDLIISHGVSFSLYPTILDRWNVETTKQLTEETCGSRYKLNVFTHETPLLAAQRCLLAVLKEGN